MKMMMILSLLNFVTLVAGDSLGWVNKLTDCNSGCKTVWSKPVLEHIMAHCNLISKINQLFLTTYYLISYYGS